MKVSDVTVETVKEFCGISENESNTLVGIFMTSALAFIIGYTGLTSEEVASYEDITTAYLCLVNDMYQNRDYVVDKSNINPAVKQILGMHERNLL